MSFTVGGTQPASFQGVTFNNIAGDMNIVSTASVVSGSGYHLSDSLSPRWIDAHPSPHHAASGPVRTRMNSSHPKEKPYNKHRSCSQPRDRGVTGSNHRKLPGAPTHSNSIFNTITGNITNVSLTSYSENGLDVLYRRVLEDAMHNSAERPSDPCCHPGTREAVLDTLQTWSQDDSPCARLLWLHGSAGIGKSAIAQTFAAKCEEEGLLGASFFFKRGDPERGNWKGLFSTLVYQLAVSFPELRDALRRIVEADKLVFGQSMRHQFQKLIVAPFEQSPPLATRPIVVIDGVDECEDHGNQVTLLKLIIEGLRTGAFPVRVLIASRPEPHLCEALQTPASFDTCRHLELHPDTSAYDDIRRYLCDEFSRVRNCLTGRGVSLENGWPGEDAINHLVKKSSGIFIYAATVVRYVDDEYSHPAERLDSILALDPDSTAPLDNLYTQIISAVPNRSTLRRVLHAVIKTCDDWDPEEIDLALQLRAGTSRLVLRGLHSLLSVPPVRTVGLRRPVKVLHASMSDFLRDPARSSDLCITTPELESGLVCTMVKFLSSPPTEPLLFRYHFFILD
ncbi:hypothetical protein DFH06DRAFT_393013 [Mycena polygramma]|nr:hypothetical protein DFH06DRAFT_393013 [Mycena polygramma]